MPTRPRPWVFRGYVATVALLGLGVLAVVQAVGWTASAREELSALLLLAGLLVLVELSPIEIATRTAKDSVTVSGVFACALLLGWGLAPALAVMAAASVLNDATHRVVWWKAAFNVGQYSTALTAAGAVIAALDGFRPPGGRIDGRQILVLLLAGAVFFLLNNTLTGTALALSEGSPVGAFLAKDFRFQAAVHGAVLLLAPVVLVMADVSTCSVLLVLLPLWAMRRSAAIGLELAHRATHDDLTGLVNALRFRELQAEVLVQAAVTRQYAAVVMIDLASFSDINDTFGHGAGDELLRQAARRLEQAGGTDVVVARFGGDQFAVVAGPLASPWEADEVVRRLREACGQPFELGGANLGLHVNMGLSVFPHHATDPDRLLQFAHVALDIAKSRRLDCQIYTPESAEAAPRRLAIVSQMRQALLRRELIVHYQPQVDTKTGAIVGAEALLRWHHAELGDVSPAEFVPLAEQTGMIRQITDYVLDDALRQLSAWRADGREYTVAVNLSARDLHDRDLPKDVARRLAIWDVPAHCLILEITETAVMADPEIALAVLAELSAMHISISVDDYGTGYSSLAYITQLPVREIKIDRSFVSGLEDHPTNKLVVRSTIDLARSLGLRVVAEGVETAETWRILTEYGCTAAQGYHFGRAVPAAELSLSAGRRALSVPLSRHGI
jgi:diguanylate cyclase (GGDEF)-like protein